MWCIRGPHPACSGQDAGDARAGLQQFAGGRALGQVEPCWQRSRTAGVSGRSADSAPSGLRLDRSRGSRLACQAILADATANGHTHTPRQIYTKAARQAEMQYEVLTLRVYHRKGVTGFEENKDLTPGVGDIVAGRYQVTGFLGSAAFSTAVQAVDLKSGGKVCLKIVKNSKAYFDQSLDEVKLLRYVNAADPQDQHGVVRMYDFFYYHEHLVLVCELLRSNLYELQRHNRESGDEPYFTLPRIQSIARQVLRSLAFLHSMGLMHCDLKPENVLIKSYSRCEVKVIDVGSSAFVTDRPNTYVQSRSYRAPEVVLGLPYGQKIDVWSLGCILAELASGHVLFQNDSVPSMLCRMEGVLGPMPRNMLEHGRYTHHLYTTDWQLYEHNEQTGAHELLRPHPSSLAEGVPQADPGFLDFLTALLQVDPEKRPDAKQALSHPWLAHEYERPPQAQSSASSGLANGDGRARNGNGVVSPAWGRYKSPVWPRTDNDMPGGYVSPPSWRTRSSPANGWAPPDADAQK